MAVSYDIGFILVSLYVTFSLADKNIPQVIGGGFVLLGVGSLIFALPHFITPEYHGGEKFNDTCGLENVCHEDDDDSSVGMQAWIIVFILGQLCHGIGSTPLYTLGFS